MLRARSFAAFVLRSTTAVVVLALGATAPRLALADGPVAMTERAPADPPSDGVRGTSIDRVLEPSANGTVTIVRQRNGGVEVVAGARERAITGFIGTEIDARVAFARRDGRVSISGGALLHRAIGTRDDVDAQATLSLAVAVSDTLRIGAEGRMRGEVVEGVIASDDQGRPIEVVSGAVAGVTAGPITFDTIAGFAWPRGPTPAAPALMAGASFAF